MIGIKRLSSTATDFWPRLEHLLAWDSVSAAAVVKPVENILADVKRRGAAAVLEYTNRFDRMQVRGMDELELPAARLDEALARIPAARRGARERGGGRLGRE